MIGRTAIIGLMAILCGCSSTASTESYQVVDRAAANPFVRHYPPHQPVRLSTRMKPEIEALRARSYRPRYRKTVVVVPASRWSSKVYTGNCPTPDSLDARGRRCGKRSAAYRPNGYDGYGTWLTPSKSRTYGNVHVKGYYRKGKWVRPYYRRR